MNLRIVKDSEKNQYNRLVTHVMQSWQWGEFRQSLGTPLLRYGLFEGSKMVRAFQLTLHKIPLTSQFVGYLPKGPMLDKQLYEALEKIGQDHYCAFIKVEPDVVLTSQPYQVYPKFLPSPKPLFTKYNYVIDLTKPEDELLKNMHQKMRYNIKVAQRHGVRVEERVDDQAFEDYLKLYFDTTKRQSYLGHNPAYHRLVWQTLRKNNMARLLVAYFKPPDSSTRLPLAAWMLINFKDTLYYPYGGSSEQFRNVMASNLVAWEAIKLGKKLKLKKLDLWGAINLDYTTPSHPWYGFTQFKQRLGGQLVEYVGTFDLVFNDPLYWAFTFVDRFTQLKVLLLKLIGKSA
ncbi:peptidoglycan bridge formation glycyltransferase FemA/FemB family protein [Candidatus Daviesbacteria bacterium]|nr:peptidoglycan bridge formation glycyltransferase FemA/FemB family protein [Candidatus Daviesbacteria bacterium]